MITFKQFVLSEAKTNWEKRHSITLKRFIKLGLDRQVFDLLFDWMIDGRFKLSPTKIDPYEQAFYAIRSVLPKNVLETYKHLGTLYRGFVLSPEQLFELHKTGEVKIYSKIMSWASLYIAKQYKMNDDDIILKYKPELRDVIFCANQKTLDFLHIDPMVIVNPNEAILSLPILKITKDMIVDEL